MSKKALSFAVIGLVVIAAVAVFLARKGGSGTGDDFSYTLGHQYAQNLKRQNVEVDVKEFLRGAEDVLKNRPSRLTPEQMQNALVERQKKFDVQTAELAKKNREAGEKFLAEYRAQPGVKFTREGLHYKVITEGKGPKPKADDTVQVHYTGKLIDGTEFDSSRGLKEPVSISLKSVIPGWVVALQMMPVGSKYEIALPAQLGYGDSIHPKIPAGSTLIFEIELIGIAKK